MKLVLHFHADNGNGHSHADNPGHFHDRELPQDRDFTRRAFDVGQASCLSPFNNFLEQEMNMETGRMPVLRFTRDYSKVDYETRPSFSCG
jgi:hypothetical protein